MAVLSVAADEAALADAAAARITALIRTSIAARGAAVVCLTGGSTPRHLYERLADDAAPWRAQVDWGRVHLFWGDERHVPPDHADSNYGMAARALVDRVPIPTSQVHRMHGELADAAEAARAYARQVPQTVDVMLLGLGEDAHIASIFPGSPLLPSGNAAARDLPAAAAVWAPHLDAWRITLTPPALLASRAILMLVAGASKAHAVHAAIEAPEDIARFPAQLLRQADDRTEWFIDAAAAAMLGAR